MDSSIFYGLAGGVVGLLLGWLLASLRMQQHRLTLEGDLRLHQQEIAQYQQEQQTLIQQRQQQEQQVREKEQELRTLYSQYAATQEKLNQQSIGVMNMNNLIKNFALYVKSIARRKPNCAK